VLEWTLSIEGEITLRLTIAKGLVITQTKTQIAPTSVLEQIQAKDPIHSFNLNMDDFETAPLCLCNTYALLTTVCFLKLERS